MSSNSDILIDVMVGNRYELQLKFITNGYPTIRMGSRNVALVPLEDLESFVRKQIAIRRPTLMNKKYHCKFSNQKI